MEGYEPNNFNFRRLHTEMGRYQLTFVTRWKFLTEKTPKNFHLPLVKKGHTPGMVDCFVEKIPFDIGKRILKLIPESAMRDCKGSFTAFLKLYYEQVAKVWEDSRKSQIVYDVLNGEKYERDREPRGNNHLELTLIDQPEEESEHELAPISTVAALDAPKPRTGDFQFKSKVTGLPVSKEVAVPGASGAGNFGRYKAPEKSPGGCINTVMYGSCRNQQLCNYKHGPESLMQDTWDYYVFKYFNSKYRRSKDQLLAMYPPQIIAYPPPQDIRLQKPASGAGLRVLNRDEDYHDWDPDSDGEGSEGLAKSLYEDPEMLTALLAVSCKDFGAAPHVHKEGLLYIEDGGTLRICDALFDSGASHSSYISQALVDKHRGQLQHLIRKASGKVRLGDNSTEVDISEVLYAAVEFSDSSGRRYKAYLNLVVWSMPGMDLIIGIPDIIHHYFDLFIDMLKGAKADSCLRTLEELKSPWQEEVEDDAPEEVETGLPCAFTGPLHYLNMSREEALAEYEQLFEVHIEPHFAANSRVLEILRSDKAKAVFVPERWEGIKGFPDLELEFKPTLPEIMRPRARPVNPRLYEAAKLEFDRLCSYFYVDSDSPIASPLVIAPKATKPFIRFCGDYVQVNLHVNIPHYYIPKVIHALEKAAGFSFYLDIDMTNSFHQIKLGVVTSNRLSVQTPWGLKRPVFLPEGVGPASGILQRVVMDVFVDMQDFMITIFDNVLILCHDIADAEVKLEKVIDRAFERGLVFKFAKTWLGFKTVTFFGYEVSEGKYGLSQERKDRISAMPMPTNQKQMQRFLGAVLFFKSFVENFSDVTCALYETTKDGFNWDVTTWTVDYLAHFQSVKDQLQKTTTIHFPDYELPWVLRADASDKAVGAVLMQQHEIDGKPVFQPIGFASQKFSDQASKWDAFKKEAYALYFGVKSFAYYLHGKSIVLETDHRNLIWIEKSQVPIVIRWRVYLQSFQIWLRNIPGKLNNVADWMSRMYPGTEEAGMLAAVTRADTRARQLLEDTHDPATVPVSTAVGRRSVSFADEEPVQELEPCPTAVQGPPTAVQQQETPLVPAGAVLRPPEYYLERVHGGRNGHHGARRTWLSLNCFFPGHHIPFQFVREWVSECARCQKDRLLMSNTIEAVTRHLKPPHHRSRIGVDRLTVTPVDKLGNSNLIVVVEHYTKFVSAYPAPDYTATSLATALFQHVCTFGLFDELWSDPGSDLMSETVAKLNEWIGIKHVVSLVDRHESNGVEGSNKQILRHLRALCHDLRLERRWSEPTVLPLILFSVNDQINSETGVRPFDAKFGSEDGTYCRLPDSTDAKHISSSWLRNINTDLLNIRRVSKSVQEALIKERTAQNPPQTLQNMFQAGDFILYRYPPEKSKPTKLSSPFLGPYEVIQQVKNDVEARHLTMGGIKTFHVDQVKLFAGTRAAAEELSQTDADQHLILEFTAYIGDPQLRTTCEFEVRFADGSLLWLAWSDDLFTTVQYETFCRENRELFPLLFRVTAAKKHITAVKDQPISTVGPGSTAYLLLRNVCPYWYDTLQLEDPYHIQYVVPIRYTDWTKTTTKKFIAAEIPLFLHHCPRLDNYFVTFYGSITELRPAMVVIDDDFLRLHPQARPSVELLVSLPNKA